MAAASALSPPDHLGLLPWLYTTSCIPKLCNKGSKIHLAVDTLGQLLAGVTKPANEAYWEQKDENLL